MNMPLDPTNAVFDPVLLMKRARAFQTAFFEKMGGVQQFQRLFDYLPKTTFFAKDSDGWFVAASAGVVRSLGFEREEQMIGLRDADIHPLRVAEEIRRDDLRVMDGGEPLIDRVEALYSRHHAKDWYRTTKLPIYATDGAVIGVMEFVRPFENSAIAGAATERLQRVVAHIHAHHAEPLNVQELARIGCVSLRQMHRLFKEAFGMGTQNFIIRTRVQAASDDLLLTDKPISAIALDHGFCDQSLFSRRFLEHTGETPLRYRKRHSGAVRGGAAE